MKKARGKPHELEVIKSEVISLNMLRVTLGGVGMNNFPEGFAGGYIKLRLTGKEEREVVTRTYTIRNQRNNEIDVDFVLHGDSGGPASRWAAKCKRGDKILIGGPGPKTTVDSSKDWVLMVGDMTALPAISVNIEQLPPETIGYIVVEIFDEADIQALPVPKGVQLNWLLNSEPGKNSTVLADFVKKIDWLDGQVSAWVASEFNSMRNLRDYLQNVRRLKKEDLYISSYWKLGSNEEAHREAKLRDRQAATL